MLAPCVCAGASKAALAQFGFDAGGFAKEAGKILGGSGGGRKDFAQAGGKNASELDKLEKAFTEMVKRLAGSG